MIYIHAASRTQWIKSLFSNRAPFILLLFGVRREPSDTRHSDALWIVENHRLHDNDTTTRVGERWDTRDDDGFPKRRSGASAPAPPRDSYTNTPNIRCIHSFRLSSRNSCTCSARWESDRRNSAGCSFRFPFPSLPSPSLSRSIWEYGRARASRQNPENSCYVFSGENNPWLVTNLSLRPGALSRQRYIGCSSSESRRDTHVDYSRLPCEFVFFHKRAPYECQGYSCLTRQPNCSATNVKVLKMIFRENNRERYTRAEYLTFREPIGDFYCYGIWNIFSSSIKYRYPSLRVTQ